VARILAGNRPVESGHVSIFSTSCHSDIRTGNVKSEDLEFIPMDKNVSSLTYLFFSQWHSGLKY
jgi:hypothetical protein